MMIPLGMGATTNTPIQLAPPAQDVAAPALASQPPLTATQIDAYVALFAAAAAGGVSQMDAPTVTTYCGYCADPTTALINWLAQSNQTLAAGVTPASIITKYQSDIGDVCASIAAQAKTLNVTTPCTPPGGSGTSSFCLFGDTSPMISSSIPVCRNTALGALAVVGGRK